MRDEHLRVLSYVHAHIHTLMFSRYTDALSPANTHLAFMYYYMNIYIVYIHMHKQIISNICEHNLII